MKARIVKIGNSQGLRLPKSLLEQTGLEGDVEIVAEGSTLRIRKARSPRKHPREGWAKAFQAAARKGQRNTPLDPPTPTRFDEEEWEWK